MNYKKIYSKMHKAKMASISVDKWIKLRRIVLHTLENKDSKAYKKCLIALGGK